MGNAARSPRPSLWPPRRRRRRGGIRAALRAPLSWSRGRAGRLEGIGREQIPRRGGRQESIGHEQIPDEDERLGGLHPHGNPPLLGIHTQRFRRPWVGIGPDLTDESAAIRLKGPELVVERGADVYVHRGKK